MTSSVSLLSKSIFDLNRFPDLISIWQVKSNSSYNLDSIHLKLKGINLQYFDLPLISLTSSFSLSIYFSKISLKEIFFKILESLFFLSIDAFYYYWNHWVEMFLGKWWMNSLWKEGFFLKCISCALGLFPSSLHVQRYE